MPRQPPAGTARAAAAALRREADPERAAHAARYFRTAPGEYAEGDRFLGVAVPRVRAVARRFGDLPLPEAARLLASEWHEDRLLALVILADRAARAAPAERDELARFYLAHLDAVDNWDLVDSSAPHVLGPYFARRSRARLRALARSRSVWRRRIAILTTLHFIRAGEAAETFRIAESLLADPHDLVHKAVGWMLREAGQRDEGALRAFLDLHAEAMPRTMLRYAIEKLAPAARKRYLAAGRT